MKFGLIGYPLSHSFSPTYFAAKFNALGYADFSYELIPILEEHYLQSVLRGDYFGLNVTIPYKTAVISYLNDIDRTAFEIGAVNTLVRTGDFSWKGFNTDVTGFKESLTNWFGHKPLPETALVLGTGGSSRAVIYALHQLGLEVQTVSRSGKGNLRYAQLDQDIIASHRLIINTTPVGMYPEEAECPGIPYQFLTPDHWVYDLVYNPTNSLFLRRSEQRGALTKNGLQMLHTQAEHAWSIWKSYGKF
jgi:shikimate dehydrogenase